MAARPVLLALALALSLISLEVRADTAPLAPPEPLGYLLVTSATMLLAPSIGGAPASLLATALLTGNPLGPALALNPLFWVGFGIVAILPVTWMTAFVLCTALEGAGHRPDFLLTWGAGTAVAIVGALATVGLVFTSVVFGAIITAAAVAYVLMPMAQVYAAIRTATLAIPRVSLVPSASEPLIDARPVAVGNL